MNPSFKNKVLDCLKNSQFWTQKTKDNGSKISGLTCPECGKNEAWAYSKSPMAIFCSRGNKCYAKTLTLSLFPEIRQNVERDYPATKTEPHKPALHYLQSRGLNKSLEGLDFQYWKKTRKGCGGAVMFPVSKDVWNGRLFNPNGSGKSHTKGAYGGIFWKHPGIQYDSDKKTYVTEGILDALSFIEMGFQAIAIISAGQTPENIKLIEFHNVWLAFDNDNAGINALKKWKDKFPGYKAILPDKGQDWNDFLALNDDKASEIFKKKSGKFQFNAELALSKTALEYTEKFYGFHKFLPGLFQFNGCYWMAGIKQKKDDVEINVYKCSDFIMKPLYKRLFMESKQTAEYSYYLRVTPKNEKSVDITISGKDLAVLNNTRQVFGFRAGVSWVGDNEALTKLQEKIRRAKIQEIKIVDNVGYNDGCYIHSHFMIDERGNFHLPDKIGIIKSFEPFEAEDALKPLSEPVLNAQKVQNMIYKAWGNQGLVAMAWTVASWFRSQILESAGFFPFLSLYGDPQTGKSNLIKLLQHCQGFRNEGHGLKKADTIKFIARSIAQRSNLFYAILEEQGKHDSKFDYPGIILTGYNGSSIQGRAAFSNNNKTQSSPLECGIVFVQNFEPFTTQQEKERVFSVPFRISQLSEQSFTAFRELLKYQPAAFLQVFIDVMLNKQVIESDWFERFNILRDEFIQTLHDNRLAEVSAILMTFHNILCAITGNNFDIKDYILQLTREKQVNKSNDLPEADMILDYIYTNAEKDLSQFVKIDLQNSLLCFHWVSVKQHVESFRGLKQSEIVKQFKRHEAFNACNKTVRYGDNTYKSYVFDIEKMSCAVNSGSNNCFNCEWIYRENGIFTCLKHNGSSIESVVDCQHFEQS